MISGPAKVYVGGVYIGDAVIPQGRLTRGDGVQIVAKAAAPVRCAHCLDTGHVCEDHPAYPWAGLSGTVEGHADCGAAGMPCRACCSPVPEDGTRSITEVFTPDWQRTHPGPRDRRDG